MEKKTNDLISRDDAISVLIRWLSGEGGDIIELIESLPSAEQGKLKNPCDSLLKSELDECKEHESKLDLISRADAIEAVCMANCGGCRPNECSVYDVCEAVTALSALQSAEAEKKYIAQITVDAEEVVRRIKEEYDITDGWIPCSERLPSESGRYLVAYHLFTSKNKWIDIMHFGKPSMPNTKVKGKCWYRSDDEWGDVVYDDIIAWLPLPKPYEGGDSE